MPEQPAIEVLLATFQGAAYLSQQVDSILNQTGIDVRMLARDDGSRDTSATLLQAMQSQRVHVLPTDKPTGSATGNFRLLLQHSTADYVALADQDDVWHPAKLQRSMQAMRKLEAEFGPATPLLVFTDLAVVDRDLRPIAPSLWRHNGISPTAVHKLGRLLGENVVTGCTALLNRPLAALAAHMPSPPIDDPLALQHDHWIALLACTLGRSAWLAEPTVQYRQHSGNVVGAATAKGSALHRLLGPQAIAARQAARRRTERQTAAFLAMYRDRLTPAQQATMQAYLALDEVPALQSLRLRQKHSLWRDGFARIAVDVADLFRADLRKN